MDFNELIHKLEGVRVINRQLVRKLEEAQKEVSVYQEFSNNAESNLNSHADQSHTLGRPCRLYTMGVVKNPDATRAALEVLNIYDGIQFLVSEDEQAATILRLGQITRSGKIPGKTFTNRRNNKGIVVWRID
jgi:hypothetical protein